MRTALDTNVILDVVANDPVFADRSEAAIRLAAREGSLCVCSCVIAEIQPVLQDEQLQELLADWQIAYVPLTLDGARLAGSMFDAYLRRRRDPKQQKRVVADFLIGAHAVTEADRLLSRDRGFYRDYFKQLHMMSP